MEDSDLFLDDPPATQARARAKFQPKFKPKPKPGTSTSISSKPPEIIKDETAVTVPSSAIDPVAEVALSNYSGDANSSFEISVEKMSMLPNQNADLDFGFESLDPLLTQSSNNEGDVRIDHEKTGTRFQEAEDLPDVDTQDIMSDTTIASGKRSEKFKPKSRLRTSVLASPPAVVESVMHPPNAGFDPSETVVEEGSILDFPTDHVPVELGSFIPPDPSTSESPLNEKLEDLAVASKEVSSNIVEINASLVSNNPLIVDDLEDGTCNDDGLAAELLGSYALDEDKDDNDGECNVEHASPKRRTSKRSKKPVNENEKPPRKRKTVNELHGSYALDEDIDENDGECNVEHASPKRTSKRSKKPVNENEKPPRKHKTVNDAKKQKKAKDASDNPEKEQRKKFSHSTRRKRRFVDESLLNMPEEEIDFAKVALKDLILYADHKERLAKKEAQALKVPLADQSTQQTFDEENARDDERSIASEQDQGFMDDQVDYELPVKKGNGCFNYQTYMKKEPRARWSKLDTELFYGAIRQFGPDFSLIQQLFPERSRHQIKLKFKNEERRSPFKISEALASRATDHSYFEKVIEQLQLASGADPESHGDISVDFTRGEKEVSPKINEEAANPKQDDDAAVKYQEADVVEDHSSLKSDEMDDDDDDDEMLSSYISAF